MLPPMKRFAAFAVFALTSAVFAAAPTSQPTTKQSQEGFEIRVDVRYLQYLPPAYAEDPTDTKEGGKGWPLVVFLHGSGQRGTDLNVVKQEGLPKLVAEGHDYPFILLSPQVDLGGRWNSRDVIKLLDHAEETLHVDKDRIYVTGLSMGGYGTWEVATDAGARLAAIVPICGGGDPRRAARFSQLPVWAFHGDADDAVPLSRSLEMIDALKAAGDADAKLTIYPGVGHPSGRPAYDDPELYKWLLAQRRKEPTTKPTTKPAR
jgi:predicted peptidase